MAAFDFRHQQLIDFLAEEATPIAEYRHELWRLEQLRSSRGSGEIPYLEKRFATKQALTRSQPIPWTREVHAMEENFRNDLRAIFTSEQLAEKSISVAVDKALTSPKEAWLNCVNHIVTALTIGVGVCLLIGFFTRIAAVAGAMFLLSVIASQPPWVSDPSLTYNQIVECAALLVIVTTAAGRWAGLDFFTHALWQKCCGAKRHDEK